jgi:hypothetical protein
LSLDRYRATRSSVTLGVLPGDTVLHDTDTGETTIVRFRHDLTAGSLRVWELNGLLVSDPIERRAANRPSSLPRQSRQGQAE